MVDDDEPGPAVGGVGLVAVLLGGHESGLPEDVRHVDVRVPGVPGRKGLGGYLDGNDVRDRHRSRSITLSRDHAPDRAGASTTTLAGRVIAVRTMSKHV